jgi:hypothetical protein
VITITVGDVLNGKARKGLADHYIYVLRDGATVLYVGQTKRGIPNRILEHCGEGSIPNLSDLGRLILENMPESHHWQVEMLTLEDCGQPSTGPLNVLLNGAEQETIRRYRPCLNTANNSESTPLPPRYQRIEDHHHWQAMANRLGVS